MRRLYLASAAASALACFVALAPTQANATTLEFTVSQAFGTGNFGSVTTTDLGAQTGSTDTVHVVIDMSPNFIINTGNGHLPLAFSLAGTGRIDASTVLSPFSPLAHLATAAYVNQPFHDFTDAIDGSCGSGSSSGGCGSTLSFNIINFQGFNPATAQFNGQNVFAAVDIFNAPNGPTGAVGLVGNPTPTPFSAVPGPIAGAGLPGLVIAMLGLFGLNRNRRRRELA